MSWCGWCGKHTSECDKALHPPGTEIPLCDRGLPAIGQE